MTLERSKELLRGPISIAHLGLDNLADGAQAAGTPLVRVDFLPPAGGDQARIRALTALRAPEHAAAIEEANRTALDRFLASRPHLVGVGLAREDIPGMQEDLFLHAGPPITWERMSGPLRGAVLGGLLLEGRAKSPEEAESLAASGKVRFDPCHHHQAVGPMAGLVTPSMPVWILEDMGGASPGRRTYCTLNEGLGKVLRYGAYSREVLERLRFMAEVLGPVLSETLAARGPIDLKLLMAQALQMGDEGHNRNRAGTSLLFRELAPAMVRLRRDPTEVGKVLEFIHANDHFFLNLSMPMAKCMLLAAEGVPRSSFVTIMSRNGTDFGVQISGMPGRWFTGPAQEVKGLYFPGFTAADANPDIGDSAIMETAGIGGFAMAAAPAIVQFVGGSAEDALATTRNMARITLGRNSTWSIPSLGFVGAPTGIDLRKVVERNLLPAINTGIAHREPGVGQVGAGLTSPPWECFHGAFDAFVRHCLDA
ncbi:MAG: DUF1116 domain-containing protein [Polyangia bacterium]|jgi:hypothetical protein|nr:DUF1116 domain-containing protein [Polyangia bacterium]